MTTKHLLDPEIIPALDAFPDISLEKDALPLIRQAHAQMVQLGDETAYDVVRQEIRIPGLTPEQPDVRCLVYEPKNIAADSGAYLHLHGGGYILGSPEGSDAHNLLLAKQLGIKIFSVDYRLAPEHPAPAALYDSYAVLAWLHKNAQDLAISPNSIAVGGESAGGGLAAALALYARDQASYPICFQHLTYPMLDDRTGRMDKACDPLTGEFVWTRERNQTAWKYYLASATPAAPAAPYVPSRATNLEGLPPAWIGTASLDLFRDENIEYAQRLLASGISAELVVYPRTFHGFQLAPNAQVTKRFLRDHAEALARGLSS